ncbi:MAG: AAA family ATPase [Prevotella sp.]|nr:AAA family ATPase [Prevotella sp.]
MSQNDKYFENATNSGCFFTLFSMVIAFIIGITTSGLGTALIYVGVCVVIGCLFMSVITERMMTPHEDKTEESNIDTEKDTIDENANSNLYSKGLLTEEKFDMMQDAVHQILLFLQTICKESSFHDFILGANIGNERPDNNKELYESLVFLVFKDIVWCYEQLNHLSPFDNIHTGQKEYTIDLNTLEGHYLYEITNLIFSFKDEQCFLYEDYLLHIEGSDKYSQKVRSLTQQILNTYANADVSATASNGLIDFQFCIALHNYNREYEQKYRVMMYRIASLVAKIDDNISPNESEWLKDIMNGGKLEATNAKKDKDKEEITNRGYTKADLEKLVGLEQVKKDVETLTNFITVRKQREEMGMKTPNISYHCVFTGNPGTGKTTVARILAGIYKELGVLKKGHLVETDRSGLVAEYVGQTAVKTNKIIDKAIDGVLFIDEAYTLVSGGSEDYGKEAIATLLKRMEDDRDCLVVILAGYTKEIELFVNSNPGLRSRFNRYVHFEDYTAPELYEIFCLLMSQNEYTMTEDASNYLKQQIATAVTNKQKDFGNARYIRNIFEKAIEAQANRLAYIPNLTKDMLSVLEIQDIQVASA